VCTRKAKSRSTINNSSPPSASILQVNNLHYAYPQCPLFTGLTFQARAGVSVVRGGDGAGKTTLLRLLAGELAAQTGTLHIHRISLKDQPSAYRQQLHWIDPRSASCDDISPTDFFASLRTTYPQFDFPAIGALAEGLSLTEHLHKPMYMLSTGSKRKVWLAAAFASGAALVLLDDPFAALDKPSIAYVKQLLRGAAQRAVSAYVVTGYDASALGDVPLVATLDLGD
jgi:ABC-type transport system involved in cytochrome c biogenesis ATPase subunit